MCTHVQSFVVLHQFVCVHHCDTEFVLSFLTIIIIVQKSQLVKSLGLYSSLVSYCDQHTEKADKAFADFLPICREMVELLPRKMAADLR